MHCPRCGQQQISEETRFCSRCGFPLSLVSEILAHGGFLPQLAELHGGKNKKLLTRKNGLKFSAVWFLFFLLIMTPLAGIAGVDEAAATFAVLGIFGGLLVMLTSLLFLPSEKKSFQPEIAGQQANFIAPPTNKNALPPPQSYPVSDFAPPAAGSWKAPDTGEFARPGSVTEGTTKLLQKDE
jgi:hypothetical protein